MHHLGCRYGDVEKHAVLFGDPSRCELIKPVLDDFHYVSSRRGFVLYNGRLEELLLTFGSLGIGGPSWSIGLHELAAAGSKIFIRVGTAGIISQQVKPGSVVIPSQIISDEGVSEYILGTSAELKPADSLLRYLETSAQLMGFDYHIGMAHSKDFLYMEEPEGYPTQEGLQGRMKELCNLGVLVTEMECAALFAFGKARRYKTGAVLAAINEDQALSEQTQFKAILVAVNALKKYQSDHLD